MPPLKMWKVAAVLGVLALCVAFALGPRSDRISDNSPLGSMPLPAGDIANC